MTNKATPKSTFKPSRALLEEYRLTARTLRGRPRDMHDLCWCYLEALNSGDETQIERWWQIILHEWQELHRTEYARAKKLEGEPKQEPESEKDEVIEKITSSIFAGGANAAIQGRS